MKPYQAFYRFTAIMFCLLSGHIYGAEPLQLSMLATTKTKFSLATDATAFVQYRVTNNAKKSQTLTMTSIRGVTQIIAGTEYCNNRFTLANHQSCLLTLLIDGRQIASEINEGPEVCKIDTTSELLECAHPEQNEIAVTSIAAKSEQKAYVTNWTGNSISLCDVLKNGQLENCTVSASGSAFSSPEAIALNPEATFLYVANISGPASYCTIGDGGALNHCQPSGTLISGDDGVAVNPAGTRVYFSDFNNNNISVCQINSFNGALDSCETTGNNLSGPSDLILNRLGTIAYVTNLANSVSVCNVDNGTGVIDCPYKTFNFDSPEGITLHPSGLYAYITNSGNNSISVCVPQLYTGLLTRCFTTKGTFDGFGNIAFNRQGTRAYLPNFEANRVDVCEVDTSTGGLENCRDSLGMGFNGPSGVLIH